MKIIKNALNVLNKKNKKSYTTLQINQLPSFIQELHSKGNELIDYDFKFLNDFKEETFDDFESWKNKNLLKSDKIRLKCGENKKYIKIAESMSFAEQMDHSIRYKPTNKSYIWIDPNSDQEKILLQLGSQFPPLSW
jgi:hypothetical protein